MRFIILLTTVLLASLPLCNCFLPPATEVEFKTGRLASTTVKEEENPRLTGLAFQLDDGTRKSHSIAQNSAFVSGFFKGLSTRKAYSALLASLYFVYSEMEDAFDTTNEVRVRSLDYPELRRVKSLERDMDYFYGPDWKLKIKPSSATQAYTARIKEVRSKAPYLLIAHQYTRYLGDLFGGQMMSGMATRSLELEESMGVDFYQFDEIKSAKDFITAWYNKLNDLDLTDEEKQKIVDEANYVFDLNIGILEELDGSPLKAMWTLMINTLKNQLGLSV